MKRILPLPAGLLLLVSALTLFLYLAYAIPEALEHSAKNSSQASNEDKVTLFMRLVYPSIAADLKLEGPDPVKPLTDPAAFERVDQRIREFVVGTHIVKVKIFAPSGLVVYSSDPKQIGAPFEEASEAILHASRGRAFSDVSVRDTFVGYSGELRNVTIVSSYLPVRDEERNIVGIAEIYSERTSVFQQIAFEQAKIVSVLIVGFAVLGAMCVWVFWTMYLRLRETLEDRVQE